MFHISAKGQPDSKEHSQINVKATKIGGGRHYHNI